MEQNYTVRADFYPDGSVLPIGLTDNNGETIYLESVQRLVESNKEDLLFHCTANGETIVLVFSNRMWLAYRE